MTEIYNEDTIEVLSGLEPVRKKPAMFVGDIKTPQGLFQIIKELVDNCIDEYLNKANKYLYIEINKDKDFVIVADKGRGIPVGIHKKTKISTLTTIFTKLHAGGKFSSNTKTAGTHGVGCSCTNALSSKFEVWTKREGKWWYQDFSEGKPKHKIKKSKPLKLNNSWKEGTIVKFSPDRTLFKKNMKIPVKKIEEWLEDLVYLCPGLTIYFNTPDLEEEYYSKEGLKEYMEDIIEDSKFGKSFIYKSDNGDVDVAMQWTSGEEEFYSFVNCSWTQEHGTHFLGFKKALNEALIKVTGKKNGFNKDDFRAGLVGMLHVKVLQPNFHGQTKEKLVDKSITDVVYDELLPKLIHFLNKNRNLADKIINSAIRTSKLKDKFKKDLTAIKQIEIAKPSKKGILPDVLLEALTKDPKKRELYIVEGGSAGGCYWGNTQIQLINGKTKSFKLLVKEYKKGIINYGYTHVNSTGKLKVVPIHPRLVKYTKHLVKVTLDSGESYICTPDHLQKMRDGSYVASIDLKKDDSLMPHYEKITDGRRMIYHPMWSSNGNITEKGVWEFVYKVVADSIPKLKQKINYYKNKDIRINIHHKDLDTIDDHPDNLDILIEAKHIILHGKPFRFKKGEGLGKHNLHVIKMKEDNKYRDKCNKKNKQSSDKFWDGNEEYRKKFSITTKKQMKDPKNRDSIRKSVKKHWINERREEQSKVVSKSHNDPQRKEQRKQVLAETLFHKYMSICKELPRLSEYYFKKKEKELLKQSYKSSKDIKVRLPFSFKYWTHFYISLAKFKKALKRYKDTTSIPAKLIGNNHKVVSVKKITLKKAIPVYDASISKYQNYALACGVYTHNTVKAARDKNIQEVLELSGKFPNALKAKMRMVLKNIDIMNMITAIGCNVLEKCNPKKSRVGKVILLSDADEDGKHIDCLHLALFSMYMPDLIEAGMLYSVDAPLFIAEWKGKKYFGNTIAEVHKKTKGGKPNCTRLKGWGQLNYKDMSTIAMDISTRKLIKLELDEDDVNTIEDVMGPDSAYRKKILGLK